MSKVINWNQFKIKDLKPNLIKNGWDDFEAYGSGKNYVENWNFESDDLSQTYSYLAKRSIVNGLFRVDFEREGVYFEFQHTGELSEKLLVRFKARGNGSLRARSWTSVEESPYDYFHTTDEWGIYEFEVDYIGGEILRTRIYNEGENYANHVEIDWIQITPVDNQHLVVEKSPLGNGLTHIQTWGGNNHRKLRFMKDWLPKSMNLNFSTYIKNKSNNITITHDTSDTAYIKQGYEGFHTHNYETKVIGDRIYNLVDVRASDVDDNLDFIASDPVIVEGDVPNPVLIVTPLEDGREHVKVYGATPDTKLVYDEAGFKGELYSFETEIENEGTYMDMTSTIGDYEKEITDGVTEIKQEGRLTTPSIEIELGASDE